MSRDPGIIFQDLVTFDRDAGKSPGGPVAGVDEAGRGALAGPVVAAAVICEPRGELDGVRDSKLLGEPVRERLYETIMSLATCVGIGIVGPERIDTINILQATMEAMREAIDTLSPRPALVLVDGPRLPDINLPACGVTGGDGKSFSIAAASIIAKVTRDRYMRDIDRDFPQYGFIRNKGYGTREHREAIYASGRSPVHRRSFRVNSP